MSDQAQGQQAQQGQQQQQQASTPPPWYGADAPPEIASLVANKKWASPVDALNSYANLEKMVGTDKIPMPKPDWKPEQWNEFHAKLRPEKPDAYEVKLPDGAAIKLAEDKVKAVQQLMWDNGFTKAQAEKLVGWYVGDMDSAVKADAQAKATAKQNGEMALKQKWGDKFDANLDVAKSVLRRFGNDQLVAKLEASGLASDPELVEFYHTIGAAMLDDSATGKGDNAFVSGPAAAQAEIRKMEADPEFQKAFWNTQHVGHKEAVRRRDALYAQAFPKEQKK